jgi:hypothetical protein
MELRNVTREQKELGTAGFLVLFIISLFLKWAGDAKGKDIDSWWIPLILAIVAGAVFAADALNVELPGRLPIAAATYLTSLCLFYSIIWIVAANDVKYGLVLALVFTIAATVLAVWVWREDR